MPNSTIRFRRAESGDSPAGSHLHADEIVAREFPRSRRGFDPEAVREWSRTVSRAYRDLEEDRDRIRAEHERLLRSIEKARERPARSGLRSALSDLRMKRGLFGYSPEDVERILEDSLAEVARLEMQLALLEAENADLRERKGSTVLRDSLQLMHAEITAIRDRLALLESLTATGRAGDATHA